MVFTVLHVATLLCVCSLFAAAHAFRNCKNIHDLSLTQIQCQQIHKGRPSYVDLLCIKTLKTTLKTLKHKYVSLYSFKTLR